MAGEKRKAEEIIEKEDVKNNKNKEEATDSESESEDEEVNVCIYDGLYI